MLTYTSARNLYGSLTNNTTTSNLTLGDTIMNQYIREVCSMSFNWDFLEQTFTIPTVASQQNYNLPYNYDRINSLTVTIGTYKYPVKEVPNRAYWDQLQLTTNFTSSYAQWYYIDAGQAYLWPTPSVSTNTIAFNIKIMPKDLTNADYTTGTVSVTNGSPTVTGSGTTFTAAMVGRYLQLTADGYWYKILSYTSATVITLEKNYGGSTATGASYTIGEVSVLPETYQLAPVFQAVGEYWSQNNQDDRANQYYAKAERLIKQLKSDHGNKSTSVRLNTKGPISNPNLFITSP